MRISSSFELLKLILFITNSLVLSIYSCNGLQLHGEEVSSSDGSVKPTSEIVELIKRYADGFNANQAELLASEIYAAPVLIIDSTSRTHSILETTKDVETQLNQVFVDIKANGWHRSKIHHQSIRMVGSDMAMVEVIFSRIRLDGSVIAPANRRANFLLLRERTGWRIIVASKGYHDESAESDKKNVEKLLKQKMDHYVELLNGINPAKGVTEKIYAFPRLSRSFMGDREHKAIISEEEVLKSLDAYLGKLKAEGMAKITVDRINVFPASKELAFVELTSCRVRSDGTAIPPADAGFSYIWVKQTLGWKMIATLAHGAVASSEVKD